jgi:hypothetical protein
MQHQWQCHLANNMQPINNNDKIAVAQSPLLEHIFTMLNESKSQIPSIIGDDLFKTALNGITLEVEAALIARFEQYINDIKQNNFHD